MKITKHWLKSEYTTNKLSIARIAAKTGVSEASIRRKMNKFGICLRTMSEASKLGWNDRRGTRFDIDQISSMYADGLSHTKIARKLGCSQTIISRLMRNTGHLVRKPERDWSFVEKEDDFFFYWLGWMLSDGCIQYRKTGNRLRGIVCTLGIQSDDAFILDFFRGKIQPKIAMNTRIDKIHKNNKIIKKLTLSVPRPVAESLKEWGLVPAKSLILDVPIDKMNEKQFYQFLCGIIEGDGSIDHRIMKSGRRVVRAYPMPRIRITSGSLKFINQINTKLISLGFKHRNYCLRKSLSKKGKTCIVYDYAINGKDATRLHNKIKENSTYRLLTRKWDKI